MSNSMKMDLYQSYYEHAHQTCNCIQCITGKAVFYDAIQVSTMATYMYFNETRPHAMQYTSCNALTQC